ncbi:hypothetical protein ABFS83_14G163300 [Erythranthe nasuta]
MEMKKIACAALIAVAASMSAAVADTTTNNTIAGAPGPSYVPISHTIGTLPAAGPSSELPSCHSLPSICDSFFFLI